MKKFEIYRTQKGTLTLRPNANGSVYTIWAKSRDIAKHTLEMWKEAEKKINKDV